MKKARYTIYDTEKSEYVVKNVKCSVACEAIGVSNDNISTYAARGTKCQGRYEITSNMRPDIKNSDEIEREFISVAAEIRKRFSPEVLRKIRIIKERAAR
jgi:hypothetical protein